MNSERLDIVQLIENNPIDKLSEDYQTQLLERIKKTFDDNDQQLFIASFYCYLQYDSKTDFVIDMDDVWKWLGFSRKDPCKRIIEKHFTLDRNGGGIDDSFSIEPVELKKLIFGKALLLKVELKTGRT